jgi:hypothetical protein
LISKRVYKVKIREFVKNKLTKESLREGKEALGTFHALYEEEGIMITQDPNVARQIRGVTRIHDTVAIDGAWIAKREESVAESGCGLGIREELGSQ